MGLEKTRAVNYDLSKLLYGIDEGRVALPDFQRDFDWTTNDVRSLLATVLSGWPIGSLLLMAEPPDNLFKLRPIEQAPMLKVNVEIVVLDGQQRLTGLYQAFFGHGSVRYGLRIDLLDEEQSIDSLDEAIIAKAEDEWEMRLLGPADQLKANIIPITALREAAEFFEWRDEALAGLPNYSGPDLTQLYRNFLSGLHKYEVPAVVLDSEVPPAGIARIFERVNRTGLSLGTFDLVVAKSFTPVFNLRSEWDSARKEYPLLDAFFGNDGLEVLSVIALRSSENVRQRAILDMTGSAVRDGWNRAVEAMDRAMRFLVEHFGVWNPDWLPYRNIPTILAALSYEGPLDASFLTPWFWKLVFERRYDVASNTRSVSDYKTLLEGNLPTWVSGVITLVREDLLECNKKQFGSLHRAVVCALASSRPRDLIAGIELQPSSLQQGLVPDIRFVSIFPRGYEVEPDIPPAHLRTLGMVLVEKSNMRGIDHLSYDEFDMLAKSSQLMPTDLNVPIFPSRFLNGRLDELLSELNRISHRPIRLFERAAE